MNKEEMREYQRTRRGGLKNALVRRVEALEKEVALLKAEPQKISKKEEKELFNHPKGVVIVEKVIKSKKDLRCQPVIWGV